jgi:hypothetical protein
MAQPDVNPTPVFDSQRDGDQYWVTTRIDGKSIGTSKISDPFVRHTVRISWRDLVRAAFRRRLEVEVLVGSDNHELVETVLALDGNWFTPKRRALFNKELNAALGEWPEGETDAD